MTIAGREKIENYLGRLRARLRGLGNDEVNDIIEELRSHILEKSTVNGELRARDVEAAIEGLGEPEDLASEYMTDAALARAELSRSPIQVLANVLCSSPDSSGMDAPLPLLRASRNSILST